LVESIGLARCRLGDAVVLMKRHSTCLLEFACRCAEHALPGFEAKYPKIKGYAAPSLLRESIFVTPDVRLPENMKPIPPIPRIAATHAAYTPFAEHETKPALAAWTAHIAAEYWPPITPTVPV